MPWQATIGPRTVSDKFALEFDNSFEQIAFFDSFFNLKKSASIVEKTP